jgi:integrase
VFYSVAPGRPVNQSTVYLRFRGYLADAGIPHFAGGPHPHSLRHGFAVANLRRWAAEGADLAVTLRPSLQRPSARASISPRQSEDVTVDRYDVKPLVQQQVA